MTKLEKYDANLKVGGCKRASTIMYSNSNKTNKTNCTYIKGKQKKLCVTWYEIIV